MRGGHILPPYVVSKMYSKVKIYVGGTWWHLLGNRTFCRLLNPPFKNKINP
eukprot:UN13250